MPVEVRVLSSAPVLCFWRVPDNFDHAARCLRLCGIGDWYFSVKRDLTDTKKSLKTTYESVAGAVAHPYNRALADAG